MAKKKSSLDKQVAGTHYDMPIQPAEFFAVNKIPFLEGSCMKYVLRHDKKNGIEDLRKASHYLEMMAELYYGVKI